MYDITETRWCKHGRRYDDECPECDEEERRADHINAQREDEKLRRESNGSD